MRCQNFFYNLSLKKILRYLFYWQVTALVTTDNKDQDSRLPDYVLKISRVFIHICLFIPLIIILRLKLDTFNSEERGTAEEEPVYQWSLTSNLRREIGKKTVYQYGGSWKIWMYFKKGFKIHDPRISWYPFGTKNHEMRGPPVYV